MEEILVFSDNKTGEKVGMYYNAWLFQMHTGEVCT